MRSSISKSVSTVVRAAWHVMVRQPLFVLYGVVASFIALDSVVPVNMGWWQMPSMTQMTVRAGGLPFGSTDQLLTWCTGMGSSASAFAFGVLFITAALVILIVSALAEITIIRRTARELSAVPSRRIPATIEGLDRVGGVVVLTLCTRLAQISLGLIGMLVLIAAPGGATGILLKTIFLLALAAIIFAIQFVGTYAIIASVLDESPFILAAEHAFALFSGRIALTVGVAVSLVLVRLLVLVALVSMLIIVALPLLLLSVLYGISGMGTLGIILLLAFVLAAVFLILMARGFVTAFSLAAWTAVYQDIKPGSIFVRLLNTARAAKRAIDSEEVRSGLRAARSYAQDAYIAASPLVKRAYKKAKPIIAAEAKKAFQKAVAAIEQKRAKKTGTKKKKN